MPYRRKVENLRSRTGGFAVYVKDAPTDLVPALHKKGLGVLSCLTAFRREHPHSAYLFDTKEAQPGARRTHSLILPQGSLKKTMEYQDGSWVTLQPYCSKPHHWAKLSLHLTDLTARSDPYGIEAAMHACADTDIVASLLPACPTAILCREFTEAEFAAKQTATNPASFVKARKQLRPFVKEAMQAALQAPCDLYLRQEGLDVLWPDLLSNALREDYKKLDLIPEGIPTLKLCDPCDRVLLESTPSPAIPVCERTQDIPEHAEWVMAHALWYEEKDAWQDAVQAHPERIYLFPYSPESLAALVGLVPEKAVETV